jgi:hypothetical protein
MPAARPLLASAAVLVLAVPLSGPASAAGSPVYPEGANPLGKSYREWSSIYAEWELEIPRGQHPYIRPDSPRNCEVVQGMAMLGASGTGPDGCTVPEGVPIMSMPVGFECSQAEGDGNTFRKLRRCATRGWSGLFDPGGLGIKAFRLTIDGQRIPHRGDRFQFLTTRTVAELPENNIIEFWLGGNTDIPAQTTKQMSKVVSHIIRPLREGWHRIRFVVDFREGQNYVINWRVRVVEHDDRSSPSRR